MKRTRILAVLTLAILPGWQTPADARYCANLDTGARSCGYATLESCEQTLSGIGGSCGPDELSQIPPNLMQRLMRRRPDAPPPPGPPSSNPDNPDWMPPPPGE